VTTDLLLFPIRIRDKRGNAPNELTERKLELKDNDRATSSLVLSRGAERIALIFALDQSGSLRSIISQQREAAAALFGRFSDRSRMAVLRFAETPTLVAPFGRDADAIRAAFNFSVGNQHTAIFDGAAAAIDSINELPVDRAERRIVVLISDGLDNASRTKAIQVIDKAVEKHISFYVIHLPLFEPIDDRLAVRKPTKGFRELAEKTGGKYFLAVGANAALAPPKNLDLTQVFQAIEEDLKSQYLLGFYISETGRDGRRHEFSVSLPEGLEYSVGKRGYARKHRFFVQMKNSDQ
jgi:VWFA-related protein